MCGEKHDHIWVPFRDGGSPPRVRGKVGRALPCGSPERITPACAGKSDLLFPTGMRRKDHPRVCGEKGVRKSCSIVSRGSPPRLRGKGVITISRRPNPRITPACAGKRHQIAGESCCGQDYPRVCGEKIARCFSCITVAGSPPRVRGKVNFCRCHPVTARIIPACAGKSSIDFLPGIGYKDHPRVCGEKQLPCSACDSAVGSPPRVRGKGSHISCADRFSRITPACAGKSIIMRLLIRLSEDHPRVCGEKRRLRTS